ncbi:MAG: hypothetical protein K5666_02130 [Bacilli bacterium]|nr:hypothetical protein [Bacilli bacterium]
MKKGFIKLLLLLMVCFIAPKAFATYTLVKTCKYHYFSDLYGYSSARVELYDTDYLSKSLYIDRFNNESLSQKDKEINKTLPLPGAWQYDNLNNWYTDFISGDHQGICPYYLLLDINFINEGYLSYDKSLLYKWEDYGGTYKPIALSHILVSDTIEYDYSGYNKTQDQDTMEFDGYNLYPSGYEHKTVSLQCVYNASSNGWTSSVFRIYSDGTYTNQIFLFNSSHGTSDRYNPWQTFYNDSGLVGTDINAIKNLGRCPYYMGIDNDMINQWMLSDSRDAIKQQGKFDTGDDTAHVLVSKTISIDKPGYDPNVDGSFKTEQSEVAKAWSGSAKIPDGGDWNPDDPYGFHVGDYFCTEKNTVKALKALGNILFIAKLAIPIVIIIRGILDFFRATIAGDQATLKKKAVSLMWRGICGVFIFFIPSVTSAFFSGLSYYQVVSDDVNACQNCLLHPNDPAYCYIGFDSSQYHTDGDPDSKN